MVDGNDETFGMLYYADVAEYEKELHNEIEKIILLENLPEVNKWTYPMTQPMCVSEARRRGIF